MSGIKGQRRLHPPPLLCRQTAQSNRISSNLTRWFQHSPSFHMRQFRLMRLTVVLHRNPYPWTGVGLGHPPEYGYPDMLGTTEFQRALGECGGSLHIRSELSWHLQVTDSWLLLNEPFSPLRNETTSILWWLYSTDGALSASGSIDADCAVHVLHPAPTPTPTPTPTLTPSPVTTPSTAPPPMPVPTPTPTATPIPTATPTPSPVPTPTPTPTPTQRFPEGNRLMLQLSRPGLFTTRMRNAKSMVSLHSHTMKPYLELPEGTAIT